MLFLMLLRGIVAAGPLSLRQGHGGGGETERMAREKPAESHSSI